LILLDKSGKTEYNYKEINKWQIHLK
jgi:hypothetical protein